jgi:hypothetical protein
MDQQGQNQVKHLVDRMEVERLVRQYMRGLDRVLPDLVQNVFHDDALVDYGAYVGAASGFIDFACEFLKGCEATHHFVGQMDIELEDRVGHGEVYFNAYHRLSKDGVSTDLFVAGRYKDRYENRGQGWRIASRNLIVDWSRTEPSARGYELNTKILAGARGANG